MDVILVCSELGSLNLHTGSGTEELKHNTNIVCNLRATGMFLLLNLCGARALGIDGWH